MDLLMGLRMFYFFRKKSIQATMVRCFTDAAVDKGLAESLVYSEGISPFYKKICLLTKSLTNQQGAVIASIVMAKSYLEQAEKMANHLGGTANLPKDKLMNMYELTQANRYLEQVFILLLKDSGLKWRVIVESYIRSVSHFCYESELNQDDLKLAIESYDPNESEIDYNLIMSVQAEADRKKHLA